MLPLFEVAFVGDHEDFGCLVAVLLYFVHPGADTFEGEARCDIVDEEDACSSKIRSRMLHIVPTVVGARD